LQALPAGYDAERHALLRREVAERQELERHVGRLEARLERAPGVRAALAEAGAMLVAAQEREQGWRGQVEALGADAAAFDAAREAVEAAMTAARQAELEVMQANADVSRAVDAEAMAVASVRELERLEARLGELEADHRHHEVLDELFTELRAELNAQLRPELAELAGTFLDQLTDGRYATVEFDEEYRLVVLEDGVPKPVLSGGEEDLCNLVLRLAVSQMIAERAGQAFSLLVLDEVFGSLDEARRANVIGLLRRLQDRFEQVIVITHIEQVRDGLDRLLPVRLDAARGCSVVEAA
jgi:exonuclease SbcC